MAEAKGRWIEIKLQVGSGYRAVDSMIEVNLEAGAVIGRPTPEQIAADLEALAAEIRRVSQTGELPFAPVSRETLTPEAQDLLRYFERHRGAVAPAQDEELQTAVPEWADALDELCSYGWVSVPYGRYDSEPYRLRFLRGLGDPGLTSA